MARIILAIAVSFVLTTCGFAEEAPKIPVLSACDLYSDPARFDGGVVEVSGRVVVEFENMSLVCLDKKAKKAPMGFGVWLRLDIESIKSRSPRFAREVADGYRAAREWKGGLRGEMRFRGRFNLSSDWEAEGGPAPRQRIGFGHFGMYGAVIVIEEVLSYHADPEDPNQTSPAADEEGQQKGAGCGN